MSASITMSTPLPRLRDADLLQYAALAWPHWKATGELSCPKGCSKDKLVLWMGHHVLEQGNEDDVRAFIEQAMNQKQHNRLFRDLAKSSLFRKRAPLLTAHFVSAMFAPQYKSENHSITSVLRKMASRPNSINDLLAVARLVCDNKKVSPALDKATIARHLLLGSMQDKSGTCVRAVFDDFQATQWNPLWDWEVQINSMVGRFNSGSRSEFQAVFRAWEHYVPPTHKETLWNELMMSRVCQYFPTTIQNYLVQHASPARVAKVLERVMKDKTRVYASTGSGHASVRQSEYMSSTVFDVLRSHLEIHPTQDLTSLIHIQDLVDTQQSKWEMEQTHRTWSSLNATIQHLVLHDQVADLSPAAAKKSKM